MVKISGRNRRCRDTHLLFEIKKIIIITIIVFREEMICFCSLFVHRVLSFFDFIDVLCIRHYNTVTWCVRRIGHNISVTRAKMKQAVHR